jgi:hypothetical protein
MAHSLVFGKVKNAHVGTKGRTTMRRAYAIEGLGLSAEFIGPMREMRCSPASTPLEFSYWPDTRPKRDKLFTIFLDWCGSLGVTVQHLPRHESTEPAWYVEICREIVKLAGFHFG